MCKISKILRNFFAVKSLVAFFIIGLLVLLPAGDFNSQPYYARAETGVGEVSPPDSGGPSGSTGSAPAGGATGAAPGLAGATSVALGIAGAVAGTPTSLGFAANVALGNAPTAAQTGSVIGSIVGNIAGSMIGGPLGGLIGGIIGGIIGGLIGSLFGGKGGGDPDASPTSDPDPEGSPIGSMGGDPSGGCFKAGTFIATAISADGIIDYREIETLKSGDEIIGVVFDPEGNPVLKSAQVLRPLRHEPIEYQFSKLVAADGSAIVGTNNHVIITDARNAGTRIENLVSGQTIVTVGTAGAWNSVAEVMSIGAEVVPVFNIETTTENYLVSLDGRQWILVHNGGGK